MIAAASMISLGSPLVAKRLTTRASGESTLNITLPLFFVVGFFFPFAVIQARPVPVRYRLVSKVLVSRRRGKPGGFGNPFFTKPFRVILAV